MSLALLADYWTSHKQDMATVVRTRIQLQSFNVSLFNPKIYEDHSTYRGECKKIAREVVRNQYSLFPKNQADPKQYVAAIANRVEDLINRGAFLHHGKDASVGLDLSVIFFGSSFARATQIISLTPQSKSSVFPSFTLAVSNWHSDFLLTFRRPFLKRQLLSPQQRYVCILCLCSHLTPA
jgi:hypothetical protein